jgi:hypothetical protein
MKKLLVLALFSTLLTACGTPTVEDFIEDPELLGETLGECAMNMAQGKNSDTEECTNAMKAQNKMSQNMINGMMKQYQ